MPRQQMADYGLCMVLPSIASSNRVGYATTRGNFHFRRLPSSHALNSTDELVTISSSKQHITSPALRRLTGKYKKQSERENSTSGSYMYSTCFEISDFNYVQHDNMART